MNQAYDFVGDIHGCASQLELLLQTLGYERRGGVFRHPERRAFFLGDFIDRGPEQRRTLDIVRPMIERGDALVVMGNHEFNAICYATSLGDSFLRPHTRHNAHQHAGFLQEFPSGSASYEDAIAWFRTLPLYVDAEAFGVVHACWCENSFRVLAPHLDQEKRLSPTALALYGHRDSVVHHAMETILKGPEHALPEAFAFTDKDGKRRNHARLKWWAPDTLPVSGRLEFGGAQLSRAALGELDLLPQPDPFPAPTKPVFVGHYWLKGEPSPLSNLVACVDYSVAKGGKLAAYRWNGESVLKREHFVAV